MKLSDESTLDWVCEHMPLSRARAAALPDLKDVRLACSMHLEAKMAPAIRGLVDRGCELFLTTCNPQTVDDDTVRWAAEQGAHVHAARGMSADELRDGWRRVAAFRPTHLCEMGADLTCYLLDEQESEALDGIRAGLEATGSGTARLAGAAIPYPVFNWDDLPIKEGLHNRHMVGLVACQAFFEHTQLTFHGRRVLVVGFGLVGQSVVDAARAYGGAVQIAELDPARALQARFLGLEVVPLSDALPAADVVITATGAEQVIGEAQLRRMKHGAFLLNVGHAAAEIDLPALRRFPGRTVRRHVERFEIEGRHLYLFAGGAMANLAAGHGDSLNAFDITLATMIAAIGYAVEHGPEHEPGLMLLPARAWQPVAAQAANGSTGR